MAAAIAQHGRDPLAAALARKAGHGEPGRIEARLLAAGGVWQAYDIVCSCGPHDRPFEERHATASISLVLSGPFACRSQSGVCLLSPGAWFLVNAGTPIECSHQHGEGDRCLSFQFDAEVFARLAHEAGARQPFARQSLPPLRAHAPLVARALRALERGKAVEEIAFEVAGSIMRAAGDGREMSLSRHHAVVARILRQ